MTLFCKRLTSTIKASKSILKIVIDKDVFFNFTLIFALWDSKLLKRFVKKLETIKTNLIMR